MEENIRLAVTIVLNFILLLIGLITASCFILTLVDLQNKCPLFIQLRTPDSSINFLPGSSSVCNFINVVALLSAFVAFLVAFHSAYVNITAQFRVGYRRFLRYTRQIHVWLIFSIIMLLLNLIAAALFSAGFDKTCIKLFEALEEKYDDKPSPSCKELFGHLFTNNPSTAYGNRIFTALLTIQATVWIGFFLWLSSCFSHFLHLRWQKRSHVMEFPDDFCDTRTIADCSAT